MKAPNRCPMCGESDGWKLIDVSLAELEATCGSDIKSLGSPKKDHRKGVSHRD